MVEAVPSSQPTGAHDYLLSMRIIVQIRGKLCQMPIKFPGWRTL
jgi:hypothetical protein